MSLTEAFEAAHDMKVVGDAVRNQSTGARVQLTALADCMPFGGDTAIAINNLVREQYTPLLMAVENAYWKQGVKAREMVESFMEDMGETDNNAAFNHDALSDLENELGIARGDLESLNAELEGLYLNVEDIMTLSMPNSAPFEREYARANHGICRIQETLGGFTFNFNEIEDLVNELDYFVQRLDNGRGLDPTSMERRNILNGGEFDFSAFKENMGELHNEFLAYEAAALEMLIRSWEGQDIATILMSLSNPMTQAEQMAFLGLLASMSDDSFYIFSAFVSYVGRAEYLAEIGLKWIVDLGTGSLDHFRRPIYVALRSQLGHHHWAVERMNALRGIGKAIKRTLPWISFGVGTIIDISNGSSIGHAIAYNGASSLVVFGAGTGAGFVVAAFLGSNPVGWALVATIAIGTGVGIGAGIAFKWLYDNTPIGYAVRYMGDVIDVYIDFGRNIGSAITNLENSANESAVNFISDMRDADNWNERWDVVVTDFNNSVDSVVNFGSDLWDAGTNFVTDMAHTSINLFDNVVELFRNDNSAEYEFGGR